MTFLSNNSLSNKSYIVIIALDYFKEESGPVLAVLRKDLQQVSVLIEVNQNVQLLQDLHVLLDLGATMRELLLQEFVVRGRDGQELGAPSLKVAHRLDNVIGVESNVLDTTSSVVFYVLLDLRLLLSIGRLIDRHFHRLFVVRHHNGSKGGVLRMDLGVVHRPESMELQDPLVPGGHALHLQIRLVAHHVINEVQFGGGQALQ